MGSNFFGMDSHFLDHQVGALVIDMEKSFRSVDFRQVNDPVQGHIPIPLSIQAKMVGPDAGYITARGELSTLR